ncbi:HAD family hydrolase, partial [Spirochaeta dissipatitropha]
MIKYIFLDFYGTIVEEDDVYIQRIAETIRDNSKQECNANEISKYWHSTFQKICAKSTEANFINQKNIEILSLREVILKYNCNLKEDELTKILFDYWRNPVVFDDAERFLKNNKIPVCIVSNIDTNEIFTAIKNIGMSFEKVITSEESKSYKPQKKIFEDALRECNCNINEVIHIGDSYSSDIKGSQSLGINNIWINRSRKKNKERIHNYEIYNFNELEKILNEE